jgi:hypothetical protein
VTALLRAIRWLWRHPAAAAAAVAGAVVAVYRWRARRAEAQRDAAVRARAEAEDTAAATTDALERRDAADRTREDVIDAARSEARSHPDDPEAAARGARGYARARYERMRGGHPDGDPADPVRGDATAGAAARERGR